MSTTSNKYSLLVVDMSLVSIRISIYFYIFLRSYLVILSVTQKTIQIVLEIILFKKAFIKKFDDFIFLILEFNKLEYKYKLH